jgi:hypothetical protein
MPEPQQPQWIDTLKKFKLNELIAELREREALQNEGKSAAEAAAETARSAELAQVPSNDITAFVLAQQKLVYGTDDRQDQFEITDPTLLNDGAAVVSLFEAGDVTDNGNGTSSLRTENFGIARNLCSQERFRSQPIGAFCSGFLVGEDLIATAGHCVNAGNVTDVRFVFGFRMTAANTAVTTINNSEIYKGVAVVGRKEEGAGADYAVVRVDRKVTGHPIVKIRRTGKIADDTAVHVIGHPVGLPIKFAAGAKVRDNTPAAFFVANLDTYGGNSGSPVFNSVTHEVEGILVRGETDFVTSNGCRVSMVCPNTGCRGEDSTRATEIAPFVPPVQS